ncbi:hypothetical protein EDD98_7468 [Streptomyces sp. PanSC19]|uniref:hypothetical protein n=1 Tax=Streptomyces sp. PanSC19 TaxID=1520455 RepID=UPI000FBD6E4A|nr:hypothetical protein [Streptomyces sp. PanSC19]ROQ23525.1 hypothetical protein EDD98_7468 [Streptomyces sp. PanSC19]
MKEVAGLGVLDSRPDGATVARVFEEVDAGCRADSGDVVYAGRTYTFPGTRAEATAHYRTAAAVGDGWNPDPEALPGDLCFAREGMALSTVFLTAGRLAEAGHGSRPGLTTGTGCSVSIDSYVNSGAEAGCRVL